jgi:hypothetical protein
MTRLLRQTQQHQQNGLSKWRLIHMACGDMTSDDMLARRHFRCQEFKGGFYWQRSAN